MRPKNKWSTGFLIAAIAVLPSTLWGQGVGVQSGEALSTPVMCKPVLQRTSELGCYIVGDQVIGPLSQAQVFWHLDTYPTPEAANAAKGPRGVVVKSFAKFWLFTIETSEWQAPKGGAHVATVGPLPLPSAETYTANYIEGVFAPGMKSAIHDHPGPEAFYTLTGETCLETPEGMSVGRVGGAPVIAAAGLPMELTAIGKDKREGFALVLHDQSKPGGRMVRDWIPKGLCK